MIDIAEIPYTLNQKNNSAINSKIFAQNYGQAFSNILNNEKNNLLFCKQNMAKNIIHNEQNKIGNITNQAYSPGNTDKFHSESKPGIADNKTSLNKTKQPKKYKDIDIDKTIEATEEKEADKNKAMLLQSILLTMLESILSLGNTGDDAEISVDQLSELDDLKGQLLSLSEMIGTSSDDFLGQNIETIIDTINKISDELLLHDNRQSAVFKSDEMANDLEKIKNNMQSILNRLDIVKKNDPLNPEEERLTKNEEILTNIGGTGKKVNNDIKSADESVPNDKEGQLFKQFKEDSEVLFKEQIVVFQQAVDSQNMDLKVKDQVIESKQFINEIAQKVGTFILKGKNEMSIRLIPEHLGKLSIKIGLNEGTLTGKIYAENYSVKEAIEANLDQLRDSLEEQGLKISSLEVHINSHTQNFENSLYQSAFTNRQKFKTDHIETDSNFITLEENIEQTNPYLIASQIDSLV